MCSNEMICVCVCVCVRVCVCVLTLNVISCFKTTETVYKELVHPVLEYGCFIWDLQDVLQEEIAIITLKLGDDWNTGKISKGASQEERQEDILLYKSSKRCCQHANR